MDWDSNTRKKKSLQFYVLCWQRLLTLYKRRTISYEGIFAKTSQHKMVFFCVFEGLAILVHFIQMTWTWHNLPSRLLYTYIQSLIEPLLLSHGPVWWSCVQLCSRLFSCILETLKCTCSDAGDRLTLSTYSHLFNHHQCSTASVL